MKGTVVWDKSVTKTITKAIDADRRRAVEAARRDHARAGVPEAGGDLARPALPGDELARPAPPRRSRCSTSPSASCSRTWRRRSSSTRARSSRRSTRYEFGTPGGEPYGALIGDYEFTNHPDDIDLLAKMSQVAAAAFCPFSDRGVARAVRLRELHGAGQAARPGEDLPVGAITSSGESFRDTEDSRFVVADDAARAVAPALRQRDQADRRVQLRRGRARQEEPRQAGAARPLRLDERGLRAWRRG